MAPVPGAHIPNCALIRYAALRFRLVVDPALATMFRSRKKMKSPPVPLEILQRCRLAGTTAPLNLLQLAE
jgi:hypothetical protein